MQLAFSPILRIAINYISNVSSREQVLARDNRSITLARPGGAWILFSS